MWLVGFLVFCLVVALIASKKGRSGTKYFLASSLVALPVVLLVSFILGDMENKETGVMVAAFLCPAIGLIMAIMSDDQKEAAAKTGEFGDYKKCPFCAESVRKEATKCKHCQSDLSGQVIAEPS